MQQIDKLARLLVEYIPGAESAPAKFINEQATDLATLIRERFGNPSLPRRGESVAVSFDLPKTSALFFDRIWSPPVFSEADTPPTDIGVYGATDEEIWPIAILVSLKGKPWDWGRIQKKFGANTPIADMWEKKKPAPRSIADALVRQHGLDAIPVFQSGEALQGEYLTGGFEAAVAAIDNLRIVDESRLSWEQIKEFRLDNEAKVKLRRMRVWIDAELIGKPQTHMCDAIATRLDDYEWALKKHGVETVTGSLRSLLDCRFVATTSAATAGMAVAGGSLLAAIGGASLLVGKAALSISQSLIDFESQKRIAGPEIAFVSEIKKKLGSPGS